MRWQAALALSEVGLEAPAAVEPLARALRSDDPYVRGFAAWSLGNLGPAASAAVPALVEALARDDGYGRGGAAAALARMGPAAAAAVPALLEGLRSTDGDRRWKAARTLGRIGPAAREAMPALAQALRDPNEHVRRHAARALGRLGPLPPKPPPPCSAPRATPTARCKEEASEAAPGRTLIAAPPRPIGTRTAHSAATMRGWKRSALQDRYAPQNRCFGCGPANEKGLRLKSRAEGDLVVADWTPEPHHEAFQGVLNGGIIGALLDCHSNWAAVWHFMRERGSRSSRRAA